MSGSGSVLEKIVTTDDPERLDPDPVKFRPDPKPCVAKIPSMIVWVEAGLFVRAARRQVDHQQNWQSSEMSLC